MGLFNRLNIYFYVRGSGVPGKKGIFYVRMTVNSKPLCTSSIKNIRLFPEEFDHKTQTPTADCEAGLHCTMFMNLVREKVNLMHIEYEVKKGVLTKEAIQQALPGILSKMDGATIAEKTFSMAYDEFLKQQEKEVGKLISAGTFKTRGRYKKLFEIVLKKLGLLNQPLINYTEQNVRDIQLSFLETHAKGTVVRSMATFSSIFEFAVNEGVIMKNPCKSVKRVKMEENEDLVWLDPEEVQTLTELELDGFEERVLDAFLFCCNTGMSIGDYELMNPKKTDFIIKRSNSPKNIQAAKITRTKNELTLCGRRMKTGTEYRVPLQPGAQRIIGKYGGIDSLPYGLYKNGPILNMIMRLAGIDKEVRFHTARKTFANYLLNEQMISPMYAVRLMGWKRIEEAAPYVQIKDSTLHRALFKKRDNPENPNNEV